jgi:hypothetical protein
MIIPYFAMKYFAFAFLQQMLFAAGLKRVVRSIGT